MRWIYNVGIWCGNIMWVYGVDTWCICSGYMVWVYEVGYMVWVYEVGYMVWVCGVGKVMGKGHLHRILQDLRLLNHRLSLLRHISLRAVGPRLGIPTCLRNFHLRRDMFVTSN